MVRVIRFDDGYHPLKPTILQIVRAVYEQLDPNNCPIAFDAYYHFAVLYFEPKSGEEAEPRRIYLIMREGEPGSSDDAVRFVLNLVTERVHDRVAKALFPAPLYIERSLEMIRTYVRNSLEEEQVRAAECYSKFEAALLDQYDV